MKEIYYWGMDLKVGALRPEEEDLIELELQVVMSCLPWVLGTKLGSCGKALSILNS